MKMAFFQNNSSANDFYQGEGNSVLKLLDAAMCNGTCGIRVVP